MMQGPTSVEQNTSGPASGHGLFPTGQLVPFILVTALFFLWGFRTISTTY